MNLPFRRSSREEIVLDDDGKPIPIFSTSMYSGCDWSHYRSVTDPLPITDDLSQIFDLGNEVHREEEYLRAGGRSILECEQYMRVIHTSEKWGVSGHLDYYRMNYRGTYMEDLKSTKFGGFYFFIREGVKKDNKLQMSIYSFLKYVIEGIITHRGVITKIDKEEPLNRMSLVTDLFKPPQICKFLVDHPVKKCILGEIKVEELIKYAANRMRPEINQKTLEHWKCTACVYADGSCPVRQAI